ncbi:HpcH/HpaI aldolase family protein [Aspergillus undulatus]|uniref:HpcH/HpaI aldolase family protein n=1 Tax=Aspergillus undulatus TaxID=1810928 RepID=UPI003CCDB581
MAIFANNMIRRWSEQALCRAFGIRLVTSQATVYLAKNAGLDALFIELEHSTPTLNEASQLCMTALLAGTTPLVRIPYQYGDDSVQRVLDGGAMGLSFRISTMLCPINLTEDAKYAVIISKYPPQGTRSMTGQLPQFNLAPTQVPTVIEESNPSGSTVLAMIETKSSIEHIDEIAAVPGVDVLIGSNDLSIELDVPGDFRSEAFRSALQRVLQATREYRKVMGLVSIYDDPELQGWPVRELGVGWILGQQDSVILARGAKRCLGKLEKL